MKPKRRWTLGGLLVVVALSALPMAWQANREREAARKQREAAHVKRLIGESWEWFGPTGGPTR
jgi:hypothetical protein